jgi:hypothetical protein
METISFKKSGEPLFVKFTIGGGVLAVAYTLTLVEKTGVGDVAMFTGDNESVNDDQFKLPLPVAQNDGCIIQCIVVFKGLDLNISTDFDFTVELYQGDVLLGSATMTGKLSILNQDEMFLVELKGV